MSNKPDTKNDLLERAISPEFAAQLAAIMMYGPLKEQPKPGAATEKAKAKPRGFFD